MRVYATPPFWWRLAIVVCGVSGLLLGEHRIAYYTTQTNVITLGFFAGTLYWMVRRGTAEAPAPRLRGAVTLWILITCLVSHVLLNGGANPLPGLTDPDPVAALRNQSAFLVHYVVPVLVVLDWLMFRPHGVVPWRTLPLWILFPLGYGAAVEARAAVWPAVPNRYPYFFLDPSERGYDWVAGQFLQLGVIFAALGALLLGADRLVASLTRRPAATTGEAEAGARIGIVEASGSGMSIVAEAGPGTGVVAAAGPGTGVVAASESGIDTAVESGPGIAAVPASAAGIEQASASGASTALPSESSAGIVQASASATGAAQASASGAGTAEEAAPAAHAAEGPTVGADPAATR